MHCNAATATLPGRPFDEAVARIHTGISEPALGTLETTHIQLCPQSTGELTDAACEALHAQYPTTEFRLHANARVMPRLTMFDASTLCDRTLLLYRAVGERSRRLGATAYTLHAGYRCNGTLAQAIDNVNRLQDITGISVGVEGLYPRDDRPQLMDSWAEYETVMRAGVPMAIDLSHLNIVAANEGQQPSLVRELVARPETIEIHLSANDGSRDSHNILKREPWWWPLTEHFGPNAVVFSEGNQFRANPTHRHQGA